MSLGRALRKCRSCALLSALAVATAAEAATDEGPAWEWSPSVLLYLLRDEADFVQPTLTVDRGALRLEGRYNYEELRTGSVFVGWNLSFGEQLKLGLTPMVGGVFGRRIGVAPGLTATVDWGPLALWSQSEYVLESGGPLGELLLQLERAQRGVRRLAPRGGGAAADPGLPDADRGAGGAAPRGLGVEARRDRLRLRARPDGQFVVVGLSGSF